MIKLDRKQFFEMFAPKNRNIKLNGEIICELGEEVICDKCNGDVYTDETSCGYLCGSWLYCESCSKSLK